MLDELLEIEKLAFISIFAQMHKPELAENGGMVWQVWEDGEITLQKSGDLLWRRTLHSIKPGLESSIPADWFPARYREHGYIFCTEEDANIIRNLIDRSENGEDV